MNVVLEPTHGRNKAAAAAAQLRGLAEQMGPGWKLPTVLELCDSLQIAKATLSSALSDLEQQGMIQRKWGSGIYVSPHVSEKTVGLVFGIDIFRSGASPFASMLIQHCERRAKSHNERFKFYVNAPEPWTETESLLIHRDLVEDVNTGKLQGILRRCEMGEAEQAWLREKNVPVVYTGVVSGRHNPPEVVAIHWAELVRMGVESLAAQGCRRIGLLTSFGFLRNLEPPITVDRDAYRETLHRLNLEFRPEWIWEQRMEGWPAVVPESFGQWEEQGHQAMAALFAARQTGSAPDGLVITDDGMARGALTAARQMGLVVGRDIYIATQANKGSPVLKFCEEPMTLLEVDPIEIVEAMFAMLERLMERGAPPQQAVLIKPRRVEHRGQRGTTNRAEQTRAARNNREEAG